MFVREKHINGYTYLYLVETVREDAAGRQGGDKQRTKDALQGALSSGWRMRDQAPARDPTWTAPSERPMNNAT